MESLDLELSRSERWINCSSFGLVDDSQYSGAGKLSYDVQSGEFIPPAAVSSPAATAAISIAAASEFVSAAKAPAISTVTAADADTAAEAAAADSGFSISLQHLVGNLAVATENGTLDQHSDVLVADLNSHFEKCQKLLNTIASTTGSKNMVCVEAWSRCGVHCWFSMQTVEGQKSKLQENEQLLNQRREFIAKFKTSVEELIKTDHSSQLPL